MFLLCLVFQYLILYDLALDFIPTASEVYNEAHLPVLQLLSSILSQTGRDNPSIITKVCLFKQIFFYSDNCIYNVFNLDFDVYFKKLGCLYLHLKIRQVVEPD
jgi:hypothetical protein